MTTAYIGIDLHRTVIQICVLDERGERIGSVIVVCALTTTPDRGVRRFLEEVRGQGGHRLGLLLGRQLDRESDLELATSILAARGEASCRS